MIVITSGAFAATVGMSLDGLQQIGCAPVMQEKQALADTPERSGAELVPTGCPLVDTIRQIPTHTVEREIRERLVSHIAHAGEDRGTGGERG